MKRLKDSLKLGRRVVDVVECIRNPKRVKARKPHTCDVCGKSIAKGEEYVSATYKHDDVYTWRECDRCAPYVFEMCKEYADFAHCGYTSDDLVEYMRESHPDVLEEWRTANGFDTGWGNEK